MKARAYPTKADALTAIAAIDAHHGYPRAYPGVLHGRGAQAKMVVTTTDVEPIRLRDGTWAVRSDRLALASIARTGEREINDDVEEPADIRARSAEEDLRR